MLFFLQYKIEPNIHHLTFSVLYILFKPFRMIAFNSIRLTMSHWPHVNGRHTPPPSHRYNVLLTKSKCVFHVRTLYYLCLPFMPALSKKKKKKRGSGVKDRPLATCRSTSQRRTRLTDVQTGGQMAHFVIMLNIITQTHTTPPTLILLTRAQLSELSRPTPCGLLLVSPKGVKSERMLREKNAVIPR